MGFKEAVISCYANNYAGFSGRAPRSEYWFFILFNILVFAAIGAVSMLLGGETLMFIILVIGCLAVLIPSLAVAVRRLHDTNASGWWYLLAFIPYIGGFIMLVWFCLPGTKGENRFGPDPLNPTDVDAFR